MTTSTHNTSAARSEAARRAWEQRRRREHDQHNLERGLITDPEFGYRMTSHNGYQLAILGLWAAREGLRSVVEHFAPQAPPAHECEPNCDMCRAFKTLEHVRGTIHALRVLQDSLEEDSLFENLADELRSRLEWDRAPSAIAVFSPGVSRPDARRGPRSCPRRLTTHPRDGADLRRPLLQPQGSRT